MVSLQCTTLVEATYSVKSINWFNNSKVICVKMESLLNDQVSFSPRRLQLTFSSSSNDRHTIQIEKHSCHLYQNKNAICGYLPDDIDSSSFLQLHALSGTMQAIHFPYTGPNSVKSISIDTQISEFSSYGKTAALSMRNICDLHVDKCSHCRENCESVMEDRGELMCYGHAPTSKEKTERLIPRDIEMPFNIQVMNVTGVAFPQKKVFCVVLKRPIHALGNIFRYLQYIPVRTLITYVNEEDEGGQILIVPNDNVCIGNLTMENEEESDAICAKYTLMPKFLNTFQGDLIIQGFNLRQKVYTFEKKNFYVWVHQPVIIRYDLDACKEQTDCLHSMCSQTCQNFVTNNNYKCEGDVNERVFVKSTRDPLETHTSSSDTTKFISTAETLQATMSTTSEVMETLQTPLPVSNRISTASQDTSNTKTDVSNNRIREHLKSMPTRASISKVVETVQPSTPVSNKISTTSQDTSDSKKDVSHKRIREPLEFMPTMASTSKVVKTVQPSTRVSNKISTTSKDTSGSKKDVSYNKKQEYLVSKATKATISDTKNEHSHNENEKHFGMFFESNS